jgi:hypothetical protein
MLLGTGTRLRVRLLCDSIQRIRAKRRRSIPRVSFRIRVRAGQGFGPTAQVEGK